MDVRVQRLANNDETFIKFMKPTADWVDSNLVNTEHKHDFWIQLQNAHNRIAQIFPFKRSVQELSWNIYLAHRTVF